MIKSSWDTPLNEQIMKAPCEHYYQFSPFLLLTSKVLFELININKHIMTNKSTRSVTSLNLRVSPSKKNFSSWAKIILELLIPLSITNSVRGIKLTIKYFEHLTSTMRAQRWLTNKSPWARVLS